MSKQLESCRILLEEANNRINELEQRLNAVVAQSKLNEQVIRQQDNEACAVALANQERSLKEQCAQATLARDELIAEMRQNNPGVFDDPEVQKLMSAYAETREALVAHIEEKANVASEMNEMISFLDDDIWCKLYHTVDRVTPVDGPARIAMNQISGFFRNRCVPQFRDLRESIPLIIDEELYTVGVKHLLRLFRSEFEGQDLSVKDKIEKREQEEEIEREFGRTKAPEKLQRIWWMLDDREKKRLISNILAKLKPKDRKALSTMATPKEQQRLKTTESETIEDDILGGIVGRFIQQLQITNQSNRNNFMPKVRGNIIPNLLASYNNNRAQQSFTPVAPLVWKVDPKALDLSNQLSQRSILPAQSAVAQQNVATTNLLANITATESITPYPSGVVNTGVPESNSTSVGLGRFSNYVDVTSFLPKQSNIPALGAPVPRQYLTDTDAPSAQQTGAMQVYGGNEGVIENYEDVDMEESDEEEEEAPMDLTLYQPGLLKRKQNDITRDVERVLQPKKKGPAPLIPPRVATESIGQNAAPPPTEAAFSEVIANLEANIGGPNDVGVGFDYDNNGKSRFQMIESKLYPQYNEWLEQDPPADVVSIEDYKTILLKIKNSVTEIHQIYALSKNAIVVTPLTKAWSVLYIYFTPTDQQDLPEYSVDLNTFNAFYLTAKSGVKLWNSKKLEKITMDQGEIASQYALELYTAGFIRCFITLSYICLTNYDLITRGTALSPDEIQALRQIFRNTNAAACLNEKSKNEKRKYINIITALVEQFGIDFGLKASLDIIFVINKKLVNDIFPILQGPVNEQWNMNKTYRQGDLDDYDDDDSDFENDVYDENERVLYNNNNNYQSSSSESDSEEDDEGSIVARGRRYFSQTPSRYIYPPQYIRNTTPPATAVGVPPPCSLQVPPNA